MGKPSKSRLVNGVIAALITAFFLVHGLLGGLSMAAGIPSTLSWIAWIALALVGAHVVASIVTSRQQLNDPERPPSARKKRHLALKWATGAALALAAAAHIIVPAGSVTASIIVAVVAVALAVHLWVGSKSLLKDLNISRRHQTAFRIAVCLLAATFVVLACIGIAR